jgi:hypothetical protein
VEGRYGLVCLPDPTAAADSITATVGGRNSFRFSQACDGLEHKDWWGGPGEPEERCLAGNALAKRVGPPGFEPGTDRLCIPSTAFAAPFGFVGWTIPSPDGVSVAPQGACRLVSTPSPVTDQDLARDYPTYVLVGLGFPEFDRYHLRVSPQAAH